MTFIFATTRAWSVPAEAGDAATQVQSAWARFIGQLERFVDQLPLLGISLLIVLFAVVVARLIGHWDAPFKLVSKNALVRAVLRSIASTVAVLIGVLVALEILDATKLVGTILGAAGVFGLALGFAFRDIVENYLASVLLAVRRPFAIQDLVCIDGHTGTVMSLTTRATLLMTIEGNHLRLPNATVFKAVTTNFTRNPMRRFDFEVGAGTQENLTAAQSLGVDTLRRTRGVADALAPFSRIDALGDSTVSIHFFGWVDQRDFDFLKVRSEAIRRVKVAFDDADIQMPEPTYRVAVVTSESEPKRDATVPERTDVLAHDAAHDAADVAVDRDIERQIAADPGSPEDGENLLTTP